MTMNLTDIHATPIAVSAVPQPRFFSWLLSTLLPTGRQQHLNDLPDQQLADLNIRRSEIATFDPWQVRL